MYFLLLHWHQYKRRPKMSNHQLYRSSTDLLKMFRLVVLFTVVALALGKPGFLHGGLGYSAIAAPVVAAPIAVPAAVSHSYRADIISKPIVAVPLVHKTIVAAPVAYAASPVVAYSGHPW
ncbi:uncharacterized protein LOC108913270 [Anoplophora glabripennis]|uniref:uncharacterized protein LOC108913270 n=1 Tax=Anoplophora glabripennis TaxID=217634 RepID=UPI000873E549|nr:uncharacterized protein LOC108913270 [Anoplophora glabripennis]